MTVIATYQDGSTREMPEEHAKVLKIVGHVTSYDKPGRPTYLTRDLVAAPAPAPVASVLVAEPVSVPVPEPNAPDTVDAPDLDSAGDAWDEALHVSTKLKNADGTWRKRPGAKAATE